MEPQETQELKEDRHFGPYEVRELIGKGGMGEVYEGWDPTLQRSVALKVLSKNYADNEDAARRFVREAQAMANISHENVIAIYFIGEEGSKHFFSMELVKGKTLRRLIEEKYSWTPQEVISITRQIVSGLEAAYQSGIVHRDLKPSNIIRDMNGRIRLLDFGLSKILREESTITQTGVILGTPDYMSPEQIDSGKLDHRSDIYSLGATLYHLLKGEPPFLADTPLSLLYKHVHEPLPPLDDPVVDMPHSYFEMVYKMMAKSPAQRYQDYKELQQTLERISDEMSSPTEQRVKETEKLKRDSKVKSSRKGYAVVFIPLVIVFLIAFFLPRVREFIKTETPPSKPPIPIQQQNEPGSAEVVLNSEGPSLESKEAGVVSEEEVEAEISDLGSITETPFPEIKPTSPPDSGTFPVPENTKALPSVDDIFSRANDIDLGADKSLVQSRLLALVPSFDKSEEQYRFALEMLRKAHSFSEYYVTHLAFVKVQSDFPDDKDYFLKAGHQMAYILFKTRKHDQLLTHLQRMIHECQKRHYSWRDENDYHVFLGLYQEVIVKNERRSKRFYLKAASMSPDKSDIIFDIDDSGFIPMKLSDFLSAHRGRWLKTQ